MKFSLEWLKELSGYKGSAQNLAELLSLHAFETEIVQAGQQFHGIIVAKVTKVEKHPNADRLRVITLTDGKNTIGPVVCGAWNFDVGAVVALALPGATIPHNQHDPESKPFTLTKATIRDIESQGMICSAKELGTGEEGSGILLLDSRYKLGENFSVKDHGSRIILDISVPANRPDLISYTGVAWEIAALTGAKFRIKNQESRIKNLKPKLLKIRISEPKFCQKYAAVRLANVKIGPSPKFIQERLKLSGLRPINNIVDITNYVMLESGQPLHPFDASKVVGAINVRRAYVNESILTLDGLTHKLTTDTFLIADTKKALAIAGIMGGLDSAVNEYTNEIILEAANFNSVSVRRSSRQLNLRTDSSSRFEKSLPPAFVTMALEHATDLLVKYASAKPMEFAQSGIKDAKPVSIKCEPSKINQLLGTNISADQQKKILTKFGFKVQGSSNKLVVSVPFWRPDVTVWEDLAEEIARFFGLDQIPAQLPNLISSANISDSIIEAREQATDLLVDLGFDEAYTYSFTKSSVPDSLEIANPLSSEQQFLRKEISMNYQPLIEQNSKHASEGSLFEIGNVFWKEKGEIKERTNLFMVSFSKTEPTVSLLIGSLRELLRRLGINFLITQSEEQIAEVRVDEKSIGSIVSSQPIDPIQWTAVELDFEVLARMMKPKQYQPISRYPGRVLDVSIIVRKDLPWEKVKESIIKEKLINLVELLEVYQGQGISPGKKSMTFRVQYQADDRTLTDLEVQKIHSQILADLRAKLNAQIRD